MCSICCSSGNITKNRIIQVNITSGCVRCSEEKYCMSELYSVPTIWSYGTWQVVDGRKMKSSRVSNYLHFSPAFDVSKLPRRYKSAIKKRVLGIMFNPSEYEGESFFEDLDSSYEDWGMQLISCNSLEVLSIPERLLPPIKQWFLAPFTATLVHLQLKRVISSEEKYSRIPIYLAGVVKTSPNLKILEISKWTFGTVRYIQHETTLFQSLQSSNLEAFTMHTADEQPMNLRKHFYLTKLKCNTIIKWNMYRVHPQALAMYLNYLIKRGIGYTPLVKPVSKNERRRNYLQKLLLLTKCG